MAKKVFILIFVLTLMLGFISCSNKVEPVIPTPTPQPTETKSLVSNIYFRRGETADGELLFTEDALQEVFITTTPATSEYALDLIFTEEGATLLERYTRELYSNDEKLSIWIGEEQIICASLTGAFTDGRIQIIGSFTSEEIFAMYDKFYGIND